ncbi:MAG: energy transducer TonB [Burkholderiales bacterium]
MELSSNTHARLRPARAASILPAIAVSFAIHAGAFAIAWGLGVPFLEPVVEAPVVALRFVEPVTPPAPVVEAPRRTEPDQPNPPPIKAARKPPREQQVPPVPAVTVPPAPIEHSEGPVIRASPTIAPASAPAPIAVIAEEDVPMPAEKSREVAAVVTKSSNESTQMAPPDDSRVNDSRIKLPHYNVAYLNNPLPAYPPAARRMRLEGLAVVRALISAEGKVESLKLEKTSGSDLLDDAAQRAVKSWRFVPARLGTETVAHWVDVPIQFRLSD